MTWAPLISAPSPRTLTTRTSIRGGPGNNPAERARYRNRARIAPIAGRSHVKGSDANRRVGRYDGTIELWDVADAARPRLESTHALTSSVTSLAFSTRGSILAAGSYSGVVLLWNVTHPADPQPFRRYLYWPHGYSVEQLAFSPDGPTLAVLHAGWVSLWDVADPANLQRTGRPLSGSQQGIGYIAFSADGRTLAAADDNKTFWLWDLANPADSHHFGQPQPATEATNISTIAYSPDRRTLAVGGNNGRIQLWDSDGTIRLWDVTSYTRPSPLGQPIAVGIGTVWSVAFSPDGRTINSDATMLAFGGWGLQPARETGTVELWNIADTSRPRLVKDITTGTDLARATALSPDMRVSWAFGAFQVSVLSG